MSDEISLERAVLPYTPTTSDSVTKHIAAIHIAGDLSTTDRKLLNVLLLNAWDDLHRPGVIHAIPVSVVAALIGWSSTNMTPFKAVLEKLNGTKVEFDVLYDEEKEARLAKKTGKPKRQKWAGIDWTVTNIISGARIADGMIYYEYSTLLRQRLSKPDVYSVISIPVQRDFSGSYALALYENCVRFKGVGTTGPISLELWKALLGVDRNRSGQKHEKTAYDEFKHFNNQVIKPSVEEINEVSDIRVEPAFIKTGRKVTAIAFLISSPDQLSLADGVERDDAAIMQTEAFRLLVSVGVGRKLALEWCATEPEYALYTARTVKAKVERNEIRNAVGYARRMMENRPEQFELEPDPAPVVLPHHQPEEVEKDARAGASKSAAARFSDEEQKAMRAAFAKEQGINLNDAGEFAGAQRAKHGIAFRAWLIEKAKEQTGE
jgi:hypothetical protein